MFHGNDRLINLAVGAVVVIVFLLIGRLKRFRLLRGECAHALLSVPDVIDQMAYAAYDEAIHYFCHCSKFW